MIRFVVFLKLRFGNVVWNLVVNLCILLCFLYGVCIEYLKWMLGVVSLLMMFGLYLLF